MRKKHRLSKKKTAPSVFQSCDKQSENSNTVPVLTAIAYTKILRLRPTFCLYAIAVVFTNVRELRVEHPARPVGVAFFRVAPKSQHSPKLLLLLTSTGMGNKRMQQQLRNRPEVSWISHRGAVVEFYIYRESGLTARVMATELVDDLRLERESRG